MTQTVLLKHLRRSADVISISQGVDIGFYFGLIAGRMIVVVSYRV